MAHSGTFWHIRGRGRKRWVRFAFPFLMEQNEHGASGAGAPSADVGGFVLSKSIPCGASRPSTRGCSRKHAGGTPTPQEEETRASTYKARCCARRAPGAQHFHATLGQRRRTAKKFFAMGVFLFGAVARLARLIASAPFA